ncbi:hypothetical protein PMAYCL1PPCAC_12160, partial [Pristionchus mayeri]
SPPVVDFRKAHDENWPSDNPFKEKTLRHIGIIVAKTGHDRGQKEMYIYSPTVKRHDGRIVCSSDFLNFEVGEWILFNVQVHHNKDEVYVGGKKWGPDPYPTGIQFDFPRVKVRACVYPDCVYASVTSRQQTIRCFSPDLGDLFIDITTIRQNQHNSIIQQFSKDHGRLYYVTADYHFNASVFHDMYEGPEDQRANEDMERKVYWRVYSVEGLVGEEGAADYALIPWRSHVWKYLEKKRGMNDWSNGVPPWYIRSARLLTFDMIRTWEEEVKKSQDKGDEKDHPVPVVTKEGKQVDVHVSDIFTDMKEKQKEREVATQLEDHHGTSEQSKYSWKPVLSYDGKMLEPGSQLPPVSMLKKQKVPSDRVELVQDSAGLFMNKAAALSYVEIKESGTDKLWTTGGWKKPGEAWESEASKCRLDKTLNKVDDNHSKPKDNPVEMIRCTSKAVASKNLLGAKNGVARKTDDAVHTRTSSQKSCAPLVIDGPIRIPSPKKKTSSFASAAKMKKEGSTPEDVSDGGEILIDESKLNEEGRELYAKYLSRKEYVERGEVEANKNPSKKGYTIHEFIKAQRGIIKVINALIQLGLREESADDRLKIDKCLKRIAKAELELERREVPEHEIYEIHLVESDDAYLKNELKGHVEIQKNVMNEMKKRLLAMQRNESDC